MNHQKPTKTVPMRIYKPDQTLNASNSRVVGLSIDRNGNVAQLRVKFKPTAPKSPRVIVQARVLLNPINIPLKPI